jgi:hypothetical protein
MLETSQKNRTYNELVTVRKDCRACPQLVNPAVAANGELDSDRIGPYSRWQGNLHSDLVVVGQDFADVETFARVGGWPGENVGTNLTLVELLAAAGFTISPPCRGISSDQVFFTNAVLCLKHGSMQEAIPPACFRACGLRFLRPTIELVSPKSGRYFGHTRARCGAIGIRAFKKPAASGADTRRIHLPTHVRCEAVPYVSSKSNSDKHNAIA